MCADTAAASSKERKKQRFPTTINKKLAINFQERINSQTKEKKKVRESDLCNAQNKNKIKKWWLFVASQNKNHRQQKAAFKCSQTIILIIILIVLLVTIQFVLLSSPLNKAAAAPSFSSAPTLASYSSGEINVLKNLSA